MIIAVAQIEGAQGLKNLLALVNTSRLTERAHTGQERLLYRYQHRPVRLTDTLGTLKRNNGY